MTRREAQGFVAPDPRSADISPLELVTATRLGLWTLVEWRALLDDQIPETVSWLTAEAAEARARRMAGEAPVLGTALYVAAEILSFTPEEVVPEEYIALVEDALHFDHSPALAVYLIHAVAAALILDSRDGIELRHVIWRQPKTDIG